MANILFILSSVNTYESSGSDGYSIPITKHNFSIMVALQLYNTNKQIYYMAVSCRIKTKLAQYFHADCIIHCNSYWSDGGQWAWSTKKLPLKIIFSLQNVTNCNAGLDIICPLRL